jgi:GTPase SAR1 family protein
MCGDKAVSLSLYDTAGHEDYGENSKIFNFFFLIDFLSKDSMRTMSYPGTDVFLICYSVISRESFANVKLKWVKELQKMCPGVPYVLVGLKTDLRTDETITQALEKSGGSPITRQEGENLAAEIKAYKYVECSALKGEGLNDVFQQAMLVGMLHSTTANK